MRYKLPNGKEVNIPEEEISKGMKLLNLTEQESIELWLDDHDYSVNEEQQILDAKASKVKIKHEAKALTPPKPKTTEKKKVTRKNSPEKIELYNALKDFLTTYAEQHNGTLNVIKAEKKVQLVMGETLLSVDIIQNHGKADET